jgi:hypothetical protein
MRGLVWVQLSNNGLTGPLPKSWGTMTRLQQVNAYDNQLTGTLPESWAGAESLAYLGVGSNRLRGPLPDSWGRLKGLKVCDLYQNDLSGTLPASWGDLAVLEIFGLAGNAGLSGTLPCAWSSMGRNTTGDWAGAARGNLGRLWLGATALKGCYPTPGLQKAANTADTAMDVEGIGPSPVSGVREWC